MPYDVHGPGSIAPHHELHNVILVNHSQQHLDQSANIFSSPQKQPGTKYATSVASGVTSIVTVRRVP